MTGVLESEGWAPNSVGEKFAGNGGVLPFRGNTVICHISPDTPIFAAMSEISQDMQTRSFAKRYSFLPTASFHMTVFNGANDRARTRPSWPSDLPLDATIETCNAHFADKLARFDLEIYLPIRMKVGAFNFQKGGSVRLAPIDANEDKRLRRLRERLKNVLQCQRSNQVNYEFHASLSYLIEPPTDVEILDIQIARAEYIEKLLKLAPVVELGAPEFCTFENMYAYERQFYLSSMQISGEDTLAAALKA